MHFLECTYKARNGFKKKGAAHNEVNHPSKTERNVLAHLGDPRVAVTLWVYRAFEERAAAAG